MSSSASVPALPVTPGLEEAVGGHAKRPFGEARHVLRYLRRYTHRVEISNQWLMSISDDGLVTLSTKDGKTVTLTGEAFLGRFVDRVLLNQYDATQPEARRRTW